MGDELKSLVMGVRMMAFEAGLRYLTDYLTGDHSFPVRYPLHNLVRARVAFTICSLVEVNYKEMCKALIKCAKDAAQTK